MSRNQHKPKKSISQSDKKPSRKSKARLPAPVSKVLKELKTDKLGVIAKLKSKPTGSLLDKNCLTCKRFSKCDDPKKRFNYLCDRYKALQSNIVETKEVVVPLKMPLVKKRHLLRPERKTSDADLAAKDYEKLIDEALREFQTTQLPPDLRIDDRDLPVAKNIIDFCGKEYLNSEMFAKQVEVSLQICADYCPVCSDKKYVHCIPIDATLNSILERVQLLEHGVCPKCKGNRSEFYNKHLMRVPFELCGLAGQRSGKSVLSRQLLAYTIHRFLKLQNASSVFNLLEEEILNCQLVGLTFDKAKTLLYNGLYVYLTKSPFFAKYNELMNHYSNKYGEEIYTVKDTFARYRHRKLFISPQGPDMRKLRGITAFAGAIDELGWFINAKGESSNSSAVKINAEEVYTSMSNAFMTIRSSFRKLLKAGNYNLPPPLFLNTSSPSSKKDQMVKIYKESKHNRDMIGYHYATTEFNPNITDEDLAGKFRENYAKALRDFGAVPPNSSMPYIEKMKQIKPLCSPRIVNNLIYRPSLVTLNSGISKLGGQVRFRKNETNIPHVLCFDAGHTNNSFAIATGYFDEKLNMPIIDGLLEVIPSSETPISFTAMLDDIMAPIIEKMNVKFVASDRWQNLKFFSDIENQFEIETGQHSLKYNNFLQFKEAVDLCTIAMPMPEVKFKEIDDLTANDYPNSFLYKPVAHLISQMLTVQDVQKDVIKGQGLTDDLFRATVLAYTYMSDPEFADLFIGEGDEIRQTRALGAVSTGNSGSITSVNGIGVVASRSGRS